jgi:integrating conjugative element membrane protein (TIGR03745 family)
MRIRSASYRFARLSLLPGLALIAMASSPVVRAQGTLPTLEDPSRGAGGGIMETLQNYGYDIVLLIALLVVASMFIGVCYHAYSTYSEIHTGRKTWGQFGLTVAVGAILLVVAIWLLTVATGIL